MKFDCGVYCIYNRVSQKRYFGSSNSWAIRFRKHKCDLRKNRHENEHLQRAWNKYGEIAFEFIGLELCDEKNLLTVEEKYLNSCHKRELYNETLCPSRVSHTKESKEKMRKAQMHKVKYVSKYSLDGIFICSYYGLQEAARSVSLSPCNISACCNLRFKSYGGYQWRFSNDGRNIPELKEEKNEGRYPQRKVNQYSLDKTFISSFDSISSASRKTMVPIGSIWLCLAGGTKSAYNFKWEYASCDDSACGGCNQ